MFDELLKNQNTFAVESQKKQFYFKNLSKQNNSIGVNVTKGLNRVLVNPGDTVDWTNARYVKYTWKSSSDGISWTNNEVTSAIVATDIAYDDPSKGKYVGVTPKTLFTLAPNEVLFIKDFEATTDTASIVLNGYVQNVWHWTFTNSTNGYFAIGGDVSTFSSNIKRGLDFNYCFYYTYLKDASRLVIDSFIDGSNPVSYWFRYAERLEKAPVLPLKTLQIGCYGYMFHHCIRLVQAPVLPAETLVDSCYSNMFRDCTSLNWIKAYFVYGQNKPYALNNWVNGVASSGTFLKDANNTWIKSGVSGTPANWTVQNITI